MRALLFVVAATGVLLAQNANASVVLEDNFSSSTPMSNWPGDSIFQSIPQPGDVNGLPSVDLVGPGYFQSLAIPGGNSVDLDGTTGDDNSPAGELRSTMSLGLGNYTVQFYLAGNLRGATPQTTVVSIGGQSFDFTPANTQGYTLETLYFTGVSGKLDFLEDGPSDQQGNLLADVLVTTPLPATWTMMLIGLAGLGFAGYRQRKQSGPFVFA
jgi:hypothetical protein